MTRPLRLLLGLAACAVVACACQRTAPPPAEVPGLDAAVREYVRLVVALGEHDADSLDFYAGPPEWVDDIRRTTPALVSIRASALQLTGRFEHDPWPPGDRTRVTRLARNLRALAGRVDVLTDRRLTFDEESTAFFGVTLPPGDEPTDATGPVLAELERLLPGRGSLADRYARFDAAFIVPRDRLPDVMSRAVEVCRARTIAHLSLPAGEGVSLEYVGNRPWSAFSRYEGHDRSRIEINADFPLTVDRALHLACHEGYPGHHVRNTLLDERFAQRLGRAEFLVQAQFSPDTLISEGSAGIAVDVALPGDDRVTVERDELCPLAGIRGRDVATYVQVQRLVDRLTMAQAHVARAYLDGRLDFVRAGAALSRHALMAHPEATLKYAGQFRSAVLTYTLGRDLARAFIDARVRSAGDAASRWNAFEQLTVGDPDEVFRELATLNAR